MHSESRQPLVARSAFGQGSARVNEGANWARTGPIAPGFGDTFANLSGAPRCEKEWMRRGDSFVNIGEYGLAIIIVNRVKSGKLKIEEAGN